MQKGGGEYSRLRVGCLGGHAADGDDKTVADNSASAPAAAERSPFARRLATIASVAALATTDERRGKDMLFNGSSQCHLPFSSWRSYSHAQSSHEYPSERLPR